MRNTRYRNPKKFAEGVAKFHVRKEITDERVLSESTGLLPEGTQAGAENTEEQPIPAGE